MHRLSLVAAAFVLSLSAFGCAASDDAGSSDSDVVSGPAVHTPKPGTDERKGIVAALHANLDASFEGQAIEFVIGSDVRVHAGWAYATGSIQGKGGAKIDWNKTAYKERIAAGVFDGSVFLAVLQLTGTTWSIASTPDAGPAIAVGPTDAPQGYWLDVFSKKGAPIDIYPQVFRDAQVEDTLHTPTLGTPERAAIAAGLHAQLDASFNGQETQYVFTTQSVHNGWAYVAGSIQRKDGKPIDPKGTDYQSAIDNGAFDGFVFLALLRLQQDGTWIVPDAKLGPDAYPAAAVGPTDYPVEFWQDYFSKNAAAPNDIFPH